MSAALSIKSLLPADDSVRSITAAITALAAERRETERRLEEARAARRAALVDSNATPKRISAIEGEAADHVLAIERLDAMRPELEKRLATARLAAEQDEADATIDGRDDTAWGIDAGPGLRNQPRKAVFDFENRLGLQQRPR